MGKVVVLEKAGPSARWALLILLAGNMGRAIL